MLAAYLARAPIIWETYILGYLAYLLRNQVVIMQCSILPPVQGPMPLAAFLVTDQQMGLQTLLPGGLEALRAARAPMFLALFLPIHQT